MSLALTKDELYELTHKRRHKEQRAALSVMGITFRVRPDGSCCVLREDLRSGVAGAKLAPAKINWSK